MRSIVRSAFLLVLLTFTPARAQFDEGDQVTPALLADTTAIVPGKPFTVVVQLTMKEGWHVYWQFGGDSGAPPTIKWDLPEGFSAGPIQWPIPKSHIDEGDLMTYIYEGRVLLPVEIQPPAKLEQAEVTLQAKLSWLVCEQICIPGRGEVSLKLPVSSDAEPANAELFAKARAQLPKNEPPPFKAEWEVKPATLTVRVSGLPADARVEFFPLPPNPDVVPKRASVSEPGSDGERTITVPIEAGGAANTAWSGLLTAQVGTGPRTGWMLQSGGNATAVATTTGTSSAGAPAAAVSEWTAFRALWMALLGGLILNLMPCVLPVIALKIFGFVSQAGEHPERVFRLGLAFVAGVFVFFLVIAGIAIGLRAAGQGFFWGMQFADPRLMLGLIALVVIFALSMFGVFEITLGGAENTLGALTRREGYAGAFVHGLFTTLLGTSCTAPLIGPVLGFAVTQSPVMIVAIFLAMAAGMSLPYFLLTWQPAWMRFLPKPGAWMERFKQLMGFVLLAVAVWLLSVLGDSRGSEAAAAATWLMLFLALASWIFGAGQRRWWAVLLALATIGIGTRYFLPEALARTEKGGDSVAQPNAVGITWEPFSPEQIDNARKAGQAVFIDFTADWCINCKVNEGTVLNTPPIAAAFKEKNVLTVKADWTNFDPVISEWLKKFQRIGVPLYVLYRPGEDAPEVFPELLTQKLILDALDKIGKP